MTPATATHVPDATAPLLPESIDLHVPAAGPDLWCTYAAVRTLRWLGMTERVADPRGTHDYVVSCRNADGGYAWSRGMPSDAWATYYCTQALRDLSLPPPAPERTARWLDATHDGGYAMMPGQRPDAWATYFSTRTADEVSRAAGESRTDDESRTRVARTRDEVAVADAPGAARTLSWLSRLQCADGGLGWSPEHAAAGGASDARACFYGVQAWQVLHRRTGADAPWDVPRLVAWLRRRQTADGGFTFAEDAPVPCMWAAYRAVNALTTLGERPRDPEACARWIRQRRGASGAFVRWEGYALEDVWASFCAVGALRALDEPLDEVAEPVARRMEALACPGGGYTYREPEHAADALTVSAGLLSRDADAATGSSSLPERAWLEGCVLPNEDGVMYMPGRGSEVRCTLWALQAGAFAHDDAARARIAAWLGGLQNPDGGFGYWEGRASDVVSTVSALEAWRLCAPNRARAGEPASVAELDTERLHRFLDGCQDEGPDGDEGYAHVPGGAVTLRSTLQALRARRALGEGGRAPQVGEALERHRVPGGGYANEGNRMPDLLTTYEAVLTADRHGTDGDSGDFRHVVRLLDRLETASGTAWTPLAPSGGGPLADALAQLLRRRLSSSGAPLPALTLS